MRNRLSAVALVLLLAGGVHAEVVQINLGGAVDKQVIKAAGGGGTPQHFGGNLSAKHAYVENGYTDGITIANGLPTNHLVASPSGLGTYQLLSYTSDNVLELATSGTEPAESHVINVTTGHYTRIGLLVAAVEGDSSFTIELHYQDGTTATDWWEADDWYQAGTRSNCVVAIGAMDRVNVFTGLIDDQDHFNLYEFVFRNVDSNRVLDAVTIGNDPNRWPGSGERWGGLFAMNGLTTTNYSPRSTPLEWLLRKQNAGTGLIDSQDDPNGWNVGYTYDEALAAIAFAAYGSNPQAQAILSFLESAQDANGSFVSAFDSANGNSAWSTHYVGNNAWVILAINYYTGRTGDRQFLDAATNCANWILQYQAADGSVSMGPDNPTAYSTEHNLDTWSALYHLSKLVTNSSYRQAADRMLSWLETHAWIDGEGYFAQGKNDPVASLDPNTFGILALGVAGTNGDDYTRCFTKMVNTMYLTNDSFTGFSFNESADATMGCVWFEGTAQAALAYGLADQAGMSSFLDTQVSNSLRWSGGMPYTTPGNGSGDVNTNSAASTVCWYLLRNHDPAVNPFRPFDRPLVLTCAVTGGQYRVTWPANADTRYQVQQSTNLVTWTNAPAAGGWEEQSLQVTSNWEERAYRAAPASGTVFYRAGVVR
jgi:hypothetical protein